MTDLIYHLMTDSYSATASLAWKTNFGRLQNGIFLHDLLYIVFDMARQ